MYWWEHVLFWGSLVLGGFVVLFFAMGVAFVISATVDFFKLTWREK